MKRIIVPIDFSRYSETAFANAAKIAAKGGTSITCIHVINSALDWKKLPDKEKARHPEIIDLQAEAGDKLQAFILDHKLKNNPVEGVVEVGVPSEVISRIATRQMADLIVIGAYGKGHEEAKFIGSTTQKVLRLATCPVLAVKKPFNGVALRKMVFASLFNEDSKPAFVRIKALIKQLGASVHFLFVNTPGKFTNSDNAEALMKNYAIGQEDLIIRQHVFNHKEVENGIVQFTEKNKAGIITVATNNRKSASSYQIGVTETVLYKTDTAVLSSKFE